jgi:hypothetical protein
LSPPRCLFIWSMLLTIHHSAIRRVFDICVMSYSLNCSTVTWTKTVSIHFCSPGVFCRVCAHTKAK